MSPTIIRRRGLLGLALAFAALPPPPAAEAAVVGFTITGTRSRARLLLTFDAGTTWRVTANRSPARLYLHMPGTTWRATRRLTGSGLIRAASWDSRNSRLVIDLTGPVSLRRATANGRSFVMEVVPGTAAEFARMASSGRVLAQSGGSSANLPLVVIDPGHGGRDPGAIGVRHRTQEKQIVLSAAQELKRRLEAGGRCRVMLTRSRDVFVPLSDRVEYARKREATLFISLHADSAPGARGASVYTLSDRASDALSEALAKRENQADQAGGLRLPSVPPEVQKILLSLVRQETVQGSAQLANLTVAELNGQVPLLPNTHRQAGFVVLRAPDIPSVLVEMGFLSHPQDEAALRRPAHRARIAMALTRAVHGWLDQRPGYMAGGLRGTG